MARSKSVTHSEYYRLKGLGLRNVCYSEPGPMYDRRYPLFLVFCHLGGFNHLTLPWLAFLVSILKR